MWDLARKELYRRRYFAVAVLCVIDMAALGLAVFVPRTWTSVATLSVDAQPPELDELESRLRSRIETLVPDPNARVTTREAEGEIRVQYVAPGAQASLDGLKDLLSRLVQQEVERLRDERRAVEHALVLETERSDAEVRESERLLNEELARLPAGGQPALGARVGQLRAELEALDLDLRTSAELRSTLTKRIAALDKQIAALAPGLEPPDEIDRELADLRGDLAAARAVPGADVARVEDLELQISNLEIERVAALEKRDALRRRIDSEFKAPREQTRARLSILEDEVGLKTRRRGEIGKLLESADVELSKLEQGSEVLRNLRRKYDDAVALNRQQKLQLQNVRSDIDLRTNPASLSFQVIRQPVLPSAPDGIPSWVFVLSALGISVLGSIVLGLGPAMVDEKVRLPESIVLDVQVPVLTVIPEYRPAQGGAHVRWRVILLSLVVAVSVGANAAFLILF